MRDYIFIQVPKTASTTMKNILGYNKSVPGKRILRHRMVKDWIDDIGEEEFSKVFSFAFVRNPWDKMVSWYSLKNWRTKSGRKTKITNTKGSKRMEKIERGE
jgi:hypothetical protein